MITFKLDNIFYLKKYFVCVCVCLDKMEALGMMGVPFWRKVSKSFHCDCDSMTLERSGSSLTMAPRWKVVLEFSVNFFTSRPHSLTLEITCVIFMIWTILKLSTKVPTVKTLNLEFYHFIAIIKIKVSIILHSRPMTLTQQAMFWVQPKSFLAMVSTDCLCPSHWS